MSSYKGENFSFLNLKEIFSFSVVKSAVILSHLI